MKKFLRWLIGILLRLLLTLLWGCLRLLEVFFGEMNKWVKALINNFRRI